MSKDTLNTLKALYLLAQERENEIDIEATKTHNQYVKDLLEGAARENEIWLNRLKSMIEEEEVKQEAAYNLGLNPLLQIKEDGSGVEFKPGLFSQMGMNDPDLDQLTRKPDHHNTPEQ